MKAIFPRKAVASAFQSASDIQASSPDIAPGQSSDPAVCGGLPGERHRRKPSAKEQWLLDEVVAVLEREIRPLLPRAYKFKLTFVARTDSAPKANILITEDEESRVAAVLSGEGLD